MRVLSKQDIKRLFNVKMALQAVEQAYSEKATGAGQVWPMVFHAFEEGVADMDIKSGNLDGAGIFGLKLVSWYGENPGKGLPALHGTSMIFDLSTGEPKAVLNAGPITDLRTGAAGAVGAKYLARPDSEKLLVVGCGELCPYLIAATLLAMPGLKSVTVVNPRTPNHAAEKLAAITEKVDALLCDCGEKRSQSIVAKLDIPSAVSSADVILTATPAYEPMIRREWVKPGTHFSCVGADLPGKQEIESAILRDARVFGDDENQCLTVGECEKPHKEGLLPCLAGEIGAVITGALPGRRHAGDITVFDSTGIALQDLASAAMILHAAEKQNVGTVVDL